MSDWTIRNALALLRDFQSHGLAPGVRIVDYRGEDLRGQTFAAGEPLTGADFRGADLTDAQLAGADLRGADLTGCRLTGARLDRADLRGARLTGAMLDQASLVGADLRETMLDGTTWERARLTNAQLSPGVALDAWGAALPGRPPRLEFAPGARPVSALAWHSGGELLAVARGAGVELWRLGDGAPLGTLTGHTDWVTAVAWSPNGTHLATASGDGSVRIWDTTTATTTATLTGHTNRVTAVAWSPNGTHLATASGDGSVRIWDTTTTATATLTGHTNRVTAVAWSPNGTHLATTSNDHSVRIWRLEPSAFRRRAFHRLLPRRLRQRLVSGTRVRSGPPIATIETDPAAAAFSADLSTLAVGSWDGSISIIPLDQPEPKPTVRLLALPDSGYAAFWGDHRYRLEGDPAGRFWWRSGLCRFEPGELDGHGVERV